MRVLRSAHFERLGFFTTLRQSIPIAFLVLLLFYAPLLESSLWAGTSVIVGAIPDWESAIYFSIVTYTTLGYGDITLDPSWRLMASFQAGNGTIMFGWSTAWIISFIQRVRSAGR